MTLSTPTKRRLPYLGRNWNQGISGATSDARSGPRSRGDGINGVNGSHEGRPSKRPRLARDATPEPAVGPTRSALPRSLPLPARSLRINVLKIAHKESEKRVKLNPILSNLDGPANPHDDVTSTTATCKITVLDNSSLSRHMPPVLYCLSKPCTLRTFKSPFGSGPMARVYLDEPFCIPEAALKVIREDTTYGLADNYRLDVELYAGETGEWPPLDLSIPPEHDTQGGRRWVLLACLGDLFEKRRAAPDVFLHQYIREPLLDTDYVADIDARWSTGLEDQHAAREEEFTQSITVANGELGTTAHQNGFVLADEMVNGDAHNGTTRGMSEEFDGETTPNRALRTRVNTVYNLKQLTDKAHGKKKKKSQARDDGHVSYLLPDEVVTLESYRCVICGQPHKSIKVLRAHLIHGHPEYKHDLRSTNGVHQFRVTHKYDCYSPPPDEFQFTRPAKGFDIDQLVRGKGSSREKDPEAQRPVQLRRTAPKKRRERRKVLVPHSRQPMYDPVSRARLEPGSELVPPEADDSWRIQKHRDNIADYVDIPSPEREYITSWDAFSLPKCLSSEVYLPRTMIEYTKEKASWIVSSVQRLEEFLKHVASLQVRGVMGQRTMEELLGIIGEAREEREQNGEVERAGDEDFGGEQARKMENCAGCGQPASSIVCLLVCSNSSCGRHFHLPCIQGEAKTDPAADPWFCNDCTPDSESALPRRGASPLTA
ncbi:uncharacterized protein DNG_08322 [Cephalotrichum gorgonifer]|uniref:Zinc finger PHD-type domain-containing protein n=1 Tax=Cephalotrichum gorgonifer TaxID=2041049 RepID=A0AAE8N6A5_9PEZI|nr:uncharacterized protein DNG_08322 [Cephalotrichum gorgonifer]